MAENVVEQEQNFEAEFRNYVEHLKIKELLKGLLQEVLENQPEDPMLHFQNRIQEIQKEMSESNVDIGSTTFITSLESKQLKDPV